MFYKFLAIASDFIPMAIAVAGIIMSYKQPQKESHLKTTLVLLAVGFFGTAILSWTRIHNETVHAGEVDAQRQAITTLQSKFDQAEISHAGEIKYLQGKVDVFTQFAPAVVKLAQATEFNTRKTYEAKMLSNKELYDSTMDIVKRMRAFGQKRRLESEQQMNARIAAMRNATSEAERSKLWQEEVSDSVAAYSRTDAEFRSSILPDAVYVRNELLRRNIPEPAPNPMRPASRVQLVFSGSLAGAYPEFDAADYLEQMAKQLPQK
jgi:hypothetical protein